MLSSNTESGITVTYDTSNDNIDFAIDAAQTGITSIYATDLILGEDSQTAIDFGTANEIDFKVDNSARLTLTTSALYPVTDSQIDLGTASLEFKDAYFDGTVTSDAFVGPLTGAVTGNADTATTATTATNVTASANDSTDETVYPTFVDGATGGQGIETDTGLTYNPSSGTLTSTVFVGALTGNVTGNASGTAATVTTAAQSNITSLGTLTTLTVDNININGTTIGHTSDTDLLTLASGGLTALGTITVGVDDAGHDVKFFGDTASAYMLWDTSADDLILGGAAGLDVDGVTNLDNVDIDGTVQIDGATTFGVDDTGVDVKFFGDTASAYLLWDTSANKLLTAGDAVIDVVKDKLLIGGTAVETTAAELNKLDGAGTLKQAGKETIWIPAAAMYPTTTNGCAALTQVETTAQQPEFKVLDFDEDATEYAQFTVAFPKSWDHSDPVTFQVFWVGLAATTGVAWALQGKSVADNTESVAAFGTAVVVQDDSQGDATETLITAESGDVTITGAAADTLTYFQIYRDHDDGNDDMDGDARLLGIKLFFTTNAANDA